jgi:capsular polysaccharide biosynthesis protein
MDFIDALRVLGRRWRVLAVGIALTMAAGLAAVFIVPTNYEASGQLVLLLGPRSISSRNATNPYLNLEPGLTVTASLIASTLTTKDAQRSVEEAGYTSEYTVGVSPDTGPLIEVSAEDTDPNMAVKTRDEVIRRLRGELLRMQSEVEAPSRQLINISINNAPQQADPLPGSKIRALAVIGGVGIFVTLLVAFTRDRKHHASAVRANPVRRASPESESPGPVREELLRMPATLPDRLAATVPENVPSPVPENVPSPVPNDMPAPLPEGIPAQLREDLTTQAQAQQSEERQIRATEMPEEESAVGGGWPRPSWAILNGNGLADDQHERFSHQKMHKSAPDDLAGR